MALTYPEHLESLIEPALLAQLADAPDAAALADELWRAAHVGPAAVENAAFWDGKAAEYDAAIQNDSFAADVLALLGVRSCDAVLDMGCGTGQFALPLAQQGCTVYAADFSRSMLQVLQGKLDDGPEDVQWRVFPVRLDWEADWAEKGLTTGLVDVALAVRSFGPVNMARALRLMTDVARREAVIVVSCGYSPRIMVEAMEAAGVTPKRDQTPGLPVVWLQQMGYAPRVQLMAQRRLRTFADRAEASRWAARMVVAAQGQPADPQQEAALEAWLDAHLVPADGAAGTLQLDLPQTTCWAIIRWNTRN